MTNAPQSTLETTIQQFRRDLLRRERDAQQALLAVFRPIRQRLLRDLSALIADELPVVALRGESDAQARARVRRRFDALLQQIGVEMQRLGDATHREVAALEQAALMMGEQHAAALARVTLGTPPVGITVGVTTLPVDALQNLAGALQPDSPLTALLSAFGEDARDAATAALMNGLARGVNPRQVATEMRAAVGGSMVRATQIARTEMLRAYRTAHIASYAANSDVVTGWIWQAARSTRTCVVCWAMDGTEHPVLEAFASHVACRCTPRPKVKTWAELGYPDVQERPVDPVGAAVFAMLPVADQQAILGPGKYARYVSGKMQLGDLVARTRSAAWGNGRRERTLAELEERT